MKYKDYCQFRVDLNDINSKFRTDMTEILKRDFIPMKKSCNSDGSFSIPNFFKTTIDDHKLKIKDLLQTYNINYITPYEDFDRIWTPLYNDFIKASIIPAVAGPKPSFSITPPFFLSARFQAFISHYLKQVEQLCLSQISPTASCPKCDSNEHVVFLPATSETKTGEAATPIIGIDSSFLPLGVSGPNIYKKPEEKKEEPKDVFKCEKCGFEFEAK